MAVNREQNLVYEPQLDPLITDEEFLEYKQQILSFLATLVRTETLTADEWGVRFNDGSFFIQANEALGIHGTKMAHLAASIPASALDQTARALIGGGARVVELDQSIGWAFAAYYEATREVAFGIRNDGTMYPPQVSTALPGVTLHGDSLAAGWAAYNMTGDLAVATGRAVTVDAIGGQRTAQAAARQGGAPDPRLGPCGCDRLVSGSTRPPDQRLLYHRRVTGRGEGHPPRRPRRRGNGQCLHLHTSRRRHCYARTPRYAIRNRRRGAEDNSRPHPGSQRRRIRGDRRRLRLPDAAGRDPGIDREGAQLLPEPVASDHPVTAADYR
jgi:hypothetical protein